MGYNLKLGHNDGKDDEWSVSGWAMARWLKVLDGIAR
jgi:hypothetical protein